MTPLKFEDVLSRNAFEYLQMIYILWQLLPETRLIDLYSCCW